MIAVHFFSVTLSTRLLGQTMSQKSNETIASAEKLLVSKKPQEALSLLNSFLNLKPKLTNLDSQNVFNAFGESYFQMQSYIKADSNYRIALSCIISNDTLKAGIYYQLGLCRYRMSDYSSAVSNTIQARNILKQLYGSKDIRYNKSLNTLGFLYNIQAKYIEAEKTFQEARQISYQINGGEDIQYSRIINNLAMVYCRLNRYEKADELFKTSLRIKEKISGKNSKDYANTLYNLADFYNDLGKYAKAKSTIEDGIEIFKNLNETNQPDYFKFVDYLALIMESLNNKTEAEKLHKESLQRREKASLIDRDDYALNLLNLGKLYYSTKDYKQAYPYIEKATALILKIYGKNHPTYAEVLITLANIQSKQNGNEQALKNYTSAIQILQSSLGSEHIKYFNAQLNLAKFLRKNNQKKEAIAIIKKINTIPQNYLRRSGRFLSEKELSDKVKVFINFLHEIYSFVEELPSEQELCAIAFDLNLFYRAYILNNMQRMRIHLFKAQQINDTKDQVVSLHRQLENELNLNIAERSNISDLEKRISEKEAEIASQIGSFSDEEKVTHWEDIKMSLAEDEAVLEFVSFSDESKNDSIFYGILLLKNGIESPLYLNIGSESELAEVIQIKGGRTSDYISSLYDFSKRGATAVGVKKKSVYELVWQPISEQLSGIKKLYLIPEGLLHRLAFSAIPTSIESVVSDSIELVYLSSSKQIIPNDQKIMSYEAIRSLVVGGVNYDLNASDLVASRSNSSTKQQWSYLPWAEKESQDVVDNLSSNGYTVRYLKGLEASEKNVLDNLSQNQGFRILHFATHGFFKDIVEEERTSINTYYGRGLMNSAIVLSGANNIETSNSNDGLLTAYTISKLDLSKTELVVLSACETALGDIEEVEGVFGMQRAFKLAGANYLILSLWQIPDRETKDFMNGFYKNWLTKKYTIREAFNKTQSELRQRFINPYQWAGFVLLE